MRSGTWGTVTLLASAAVFSAASCHERTSPGRPAPTPGPRAVVREVSALSGGAQVTRGERFRFAVIGTGTGTHFGPSTFLHSPAFDDLRVIAVESSARLLAQGTVSLAAGSGKKDLAVVTAGELAIAPWAFEVSAEPFFIRLGAPPAASDAPVDAPSEDAGALDPPGDVDIFEIVPADSGAHTLVIRLDRVNIAPPGFLPTLEVYRADGTLAASSEGRCTWIQVASRTPVFVRVADPSGQGGSDRRYRMVAAYAPPETCLTVSPGDLP